MIVGRSGTGKTTIAKEVFTAGYIEPHSYGTAAIVNEMPEGIPYATITKMFTAVGFSSPPSWLKPYAVLSNGERMRVDLARALLEDRDVIVFDEYTSVVDRDVAKVCSLAVNKAIRNQNKKFIAVSCHDDIIAWLQPDWVYDTNQQTFSFRDRNEPRPEIKVDVFDTHRNARLWPLFGKYHYLNTEVKKGTDIFVGCINNAPGRFLRCEAFSPPEKSPVKDDSPVGCPARLPRHRHRYTVPGIRCRPVYKEGIYHASRHLAGFAHQFAHKTRLAHGLLRPPDKAGWRAGMP